MNVVGVFALVCVCVVHCSYNIQHIDDFDDLLQTDGLLYVVAVKNPLAWFVSVCKFWSGGGNTNWARQLRGDILPNCASHLLSKRKGFGTTTVTERNQRKLRQQQQQQQLAKANANAKSQTNGNSNSNSNGNSHGNMAISNGNSNGNSHGNMAISNGNSNGNGNGNSVAEEIVPANPFITEYIRLYNGYYTRWLELASKSPERVVVVKYEDVLQDCPSVLAKVRTAANISKELVKPSYCATRTSSPSYGGGGVIPRIPRRLTNSKANANANANANADADANAKPKDALWEKKRTHYVEQKYLEELLVEDIQAIREAVAPELMRALGYGHEFGL